jgi:hypothetical protein
MTQTTPAGLGDGDQCVMNIGPREQRKRLEFGVNALCVAQLLAAFLIIAAVPRVWLLVVALPLWIAGSGIFQYREKT